jgi:hypothetical protein
MSNKFINVDDARVKSEREAGAVAAGEQATNSNTLYSRRECVSIGLSTMLDNTGTMSNPWGDREYPFLSPWIVGAGPRSYLTTCHTKYVNPRVEAVIMYVASHAKRTSSADTFLRSGDVDLNNWLVDGLVNYSIDIKQGGVSVGSASFSDVPTTYWPQLYSFIPPFLLNVGIQNNVASGADLMMREGWMDIDMGNGHDVQLIKTWKLSADVTGSFDRSQPFHLVFMMEQQTVAGTPSYPAPGPGSGVDESVDVDDCRIDVIGFSAWCTQ